MDEKEEEGFHCADDLFLLYIVHIGALQGLRRFRDGNMSG
jgi:hypothetical protein